MAGKTVFITGATGSVGAVLCDRLVASNTPITAMMHRAPHIRRTNGRLLELTGNSATVRGDLTVPQFGLSRQEYIRLQNSTEVFIHSAALVSFDRAKREYDLVNIQGTQNVLEFCRSAPTPIPLVYLSTVVACGLKAGKVPEMPFVNGPQTHFRNGYEASKSRAEALVMDEIERGHPCVIVRPSIVVGNSTNGATTDFQGFYYVLRGLSEGRVSAIPASFDASVDLVPVDHVVDVVTAVLRAGKDCYGQIFHAVGRSPVTLKDFSDVIAEYPCLKAPRFIPEETFDSSRLPAEEKNYYTQNLQLYEPYFATRLSFGQDRTCGLLGRTAHRTGRGQLRAILDYGLKVGYFGRRSRRMLRHG